MKLACLLAMTLTLATALAGPERAARAAARVLPIMAEDLKQRGLRSGDSVFIRAFKQEARLELWMQPANHQRFTLFKSYPIAALSGVLGPKLAEGDRQVPEGFYAFGERHLHPASAYHLAINIGFPNAYDRAHQRTGSFIMIHGGNASIGCLAMTDSAIEEIYTLCSAALKNGQPFIRVHLFPFEMTTKKLAVARGARWLPFWKNLAKGYQIFEQSRIPPETTTNHRKYVFRR